MTDEKIGKLILIQTEDDFCPAQFRVEIEYIKEEMTIHEVVSYIEKFLKMAGWTCFDRLEVRKEKNDKQ